MVSQNGTAATSLTFSSLTANPGGGALIRGSGLGSSAPGSGIGNVLFTTAPAFVGSAVATTATNRGVLPYLLADTSAVGLGSGLATYDTANGVRPLATGEFVRSLAASVSAGAGDNVISAAGESGLASRTVNSLQLQAGGGATLLPGASLTVTSGGALFQPGNAGLAGGTVNLASSYTPGLFLWVTGSVVDVTNITSNLSGAQGLVKAGGGTLALGGTTTAGGDVYVTEGSLRLGGGALFTSTARLLVAAGATFDVNGGSASVAGLAGGDTSLTTPSTILLGAGRLSVALNSSATYAGTISGAAGSMVSKSGTADLTLNPATGANYTFRTLSVDGGSVTLGNCNLNAAVVLNPGGSLITGSGRVIGSGGVTVNVNATLSTGGGNEIAAVPISLNGGTLSSPFINAAVGNTGALTLAPGHSSVVIDGSSQTSVAGPTGDAVSSLSRAPGSILTLGDPVVAAPAIGGDVPASGTVARFGVTGMAAGTGSMTVDASSVPYLLSPGPAAPRIWLSIRAATFAAPPRRASGRSAPGNISARWSMPGRPFPTRATTCSPTAASSISVPASAP